MVETITPNHRLVTHVDILRLHHGDHPLGRFNAAFAVLVTKAVGSMWCAYLFALIAFASLPAAIQSGSLVILVSWLSQTFIQLVLLSVIMVGQQVLQKASDERAEADHETITIEKDLLTAVLDLTREIHTIQPAQLNALNEIQSRLPVSIGAKK